MVSLDYNSYLSDTTHTVKNTALLQSAQFLHLLDFLNSSRAGTAQKEYGITFQTFITSLTLTILYFFFQTTVFSLIRNKFLQIYQPNCHFKKKEECLPMLNNKLFGWLTYVLLEPLKNYKRMGLDAYLFLRFLSFLLTLFSGLAIFNIPVLIPVNYMSGYDHYTLSDRLSFTNGTSPIVKGLDRLSMSNISPKFSNRLSIHLTMTVISIIWFHSLIIYELLGYIKIKNEWLQNMDNYTKPMVSQRQFTNTILIDNVPLKLLEKKALNDIFSHINGARIKNIWLVYDYGDLKAIYEKHLKLGDQIEYLETQLILRKQFLQQLDDPQHTVSPRSNRNELKRSMRDFLNYSIEWRYTVIPTFTYHNVSEQLVPLTTKYLENYHIYQSKKNRLVLRESGPMNDHKYNKVFIQFETTLQPDILNQIQISSKINHLDKTLIRVNPKDIIWENLSIQSNMLVFVRVVTGNFLECVLILCWVIPVSFVGLISQVPFISRLVPVLSWLSLLPEYMTDVISNIFSVVFLLCLMEMAPSLMRVLSYIKCKRTGAEVELDVQKWMFVFSFIHVFMVVTISSGFTVITESLLHNPVSIPDILANNLPKCANFFFSYVIIRGISYFGNNLMQNWRLMKAVIYDRYVDLTPRQKFMRNANIPVYKWGSLYPSFAVLASIGLIYSILSPLILIFILIAFALALISFKYSIMFQFSHDNPSETYGQFYPRALFHLYTGIYFLEICLIGIFASSRDIYNQSNCLYHALLTLVLLVLTATGQAQLHKMFGKLLSRNLPMTLHRVDTEKEGAVPAEKKGQYDLVSVPLKVNSLFDDTFYEKCFQHNNRIIWLPRDFYGISHEEVSYLKNLGINACDHHSDLTVDGEIQVHNCTPDFIHV